MVSHCNLPDPVRQSAEPLLFMFIADHIPDGIRTAENGNTISRSRYACIQQIPVHQHPGPSQKGHDHSRVLTALRFVYRDRVGKLHLIHHGKRIGHSLALIILYRHKLAKLIDLQNRSHIPIKDPQPLINGNTLFADHIPFKLIIVFGLHNLIALPEQRPPTFMLHFSGRGRIDILLENLV